jgi:hypothetical protein
MSDWGLEASEQLGDANCLSSQEMRIDRATWWRETSEQPSGIELVK